MSTITALNKIIQIRETVHNREKNPKYPTPSIDKVLEWLDDIQRELENE